MKPLKIGFIGAGFIANFLALAMKQVSPCELAGIYAQTGGEQLADFAKINRLGEPEIYKTVAQICNNCDTIAPATGSDGNFTLARSTEEHAGPHSGWFWDPTQQGGGVLSDMGCHSIAAARHILTPAGKPVTFLEPIAMQFDTSLLKWGQPKYREQLLAKFGVDY